jgi:hypothetical protein
LKLIPHHLGQISCSEHCRWVVETRVLPRSLAFSGAFLPLVAGGSCQVVQVPGPQVLGNSCPRSRGAERAHLKKAAKQGDDGAGAYINLEGGLAITLNLEISPQAVPVLVGLSGHINACTSIKSSLIASVETHCPRGRRPTNLSQKAVKKAAKQGDDGAGAYINLEGGLAIRNFLQPLTICVGGGSYSVPS